MDVVKRTKRVTGFITGCFDGLHRGHYDILKFAKAMCDYLIVGLTSDEHMGNRKRPPKYIWNDRYESLVHLKYVDHIIVDNGEPKSTQYEMYRFDVLIAVDEYIKDPDHVRFKLEHPSVPVYFYGRVPNVSSSATLSREFMQMLRNFEVLSIGVGGTLMRLRTPNGFVIIKPVCIGVSEYSAGTGNVYSLPFPDVPRNWKGRENEGLPVYPNISGVNSMREVVIQQLLNRFDWNTVFDVVLKYTYTGKVEAKADGTFNPHVIGLERARPICVYWLMQHDGGISLDEWLKHRHEKEDYKEVHDQIRTICNDLNSINVVHGDIHQFNVLVNEKTNKVSLIDFGWCSHAMFDMEDDEVAYHNEWLRDDKDWKHYMTAIGHVIQGLID